MPDLYLERWTEGPSPNDRRDQLQGGPPNPRHEGTAPAGGRPHGLEGGGGGGNWARYSAVPNLLTLAFVRICSVRMLPYVRIR